MGLPGRAILKDITIKEAEEILVKNFGSIAATAKELGYSEPAIYDLVDVYPELQEARKKGIARNKHRKRDHSRQVLKRLLDRVDEDPTNAGRQAQYILSKDKESEYYVEPKGADDNAEEDRRVLAALAEQLGSPPKPKDQ